MSLVKIEEKSELADWEAVTLSQLGSLYCGQSPASSTVNTEGNGTVYITGPEQWDGRDIVSNKWTTDPKRIAPDNSIFITVKGSVGDMFRGSSCAIGRDIYAFKPSDVLNFEYVYLAIQEGVNEIVLFAKGDIPGISKNHILDHKIYLPNRRTQDLVVAKIEELFSELDKGIESLKAAREQLKVYRQALLKHAFEGKLTEQWRKDNADKLETADQLLARIKQERETRYQQKLEEWKAAVERWEVGGREGRSPSRPKKLKQLKPIEADVEETLPDLPGGWVWEKLGWMTTGVEYGTSAKSQQHGSYAVLRMGNIQNTKFDWSDLVYTSDEEEIKKYLLQEGDVLFNRTNSSELVGKSAIYTKAIPALFAGYLIRVNHIDRLVLSQYLNLFLNSHVAKQYGNTVKTDGVNQSNINGEKLTNYPFPYCSVFEQREVVEILDEKLSIIDAYLNDTENNLIRAEALRQSILKKAFSGQLVAQDPNDEPASVLLTRIAAEKAEADAKAKKTRASKKKRQSNRFSAKVLPFKTRVEGISTTDLHAGILALAYRHYEASDKALQNFGHVKGEKIAHLVEAHLGIDLERKPVKDAAGPNDYPHLMKIESRARKAGFFSVKREGARYVLHKGRQFDALLNKSTGALGDRLGDIEALLELLKPLDTRQAEIVATLYAAWNNLLLDGEHPDDEAIVHEARENWHRDKLGIERGRFFKGLQWMRDKGLVPEGRGEKVVARQRKRR